MKLIDIIKGMLPNSPNIEETLKKELDKKEPKLKHILEIVNINKGDAEVDDEKIAEAFSQEFPTQSDTPKEAQTKPDMSNREEELKSNPNADDESDKSNNDEKTGAAITGKKDITSEQENPVDETKNNKDRYTGYKNYLERMRSGK